MKLYEKDGIAIFAFQESKFALDGGAMFGVVPKVLWNRETPGDEDNRINLSANILLIKHPEYTALIEQGMGEQWNEKQVKIFNIRRDKTQVEYLAGLGVEPEEVTDVILTHLHFDHCGGAVSIDSNGELVPTFPNAKYYVQQSQFEEATNPHERNKGSYIPETFMPLKDAGQLEFLDGDGDILPGLKTIVTGGHAQGHQIIEIDYDGFMGVYVGDLVPTAHHMNLAWIMGYDLFPTETLEMKKKLLPRYAEEERLVFFPHEDRFFGGFVWVDEKERFRVKKLRGSL